LTEILPEGQKGEARLEHFKVGEPSARMMFRPSEYVPKGKYIRLYVNGHMVMSNTSMEKRTNYDAVSNAHGHVLIGGLGVGLIIIPMLNKPEVESITVIERSQDVIDLILPHIKHPKLKVICADMMEWKPTNGARYNTIYFDIWTDICTDNLDDIAKLHQRFKNRKDKDDPNAWMSSWQVENLRSQRRSEQARERNYGW